MANKLFADLLKEELARQETVTNGVVSMSREDLKKACEVIKDQMGLYGPTTGATKLSMKEVFGTADASILIPKVIDDQLIRPLEPIMVASTQLARTIQVANARSVVFPTMGAIRASEIGETQNYPEVAPSFNEMTTEVKVSKFGVLIPISDQIIEDSMWDVLALFLEQGRYAMARLKEEKCFNELTQNSHVVFDNNLAATAAHTTGMDNAATTQAANGTMSYNDLVDAIGVLVTNGYNPTDITMHPMIWSVWAKDPLVQFQTLTSGSLGSMFQNPGPGGIAAHMPVGFNVNISPFIDYTAANTTISWSSVSGCPTSHVYITDRNQSLVILSKSPLSTEDLADPLRDIRLLKLKELYGVGTLNAGKSSVVLKNVAIARNYEALYTVKSV